VLTETDPRVTAYINMFAVLGTLPLLCELVPEARDILAGGATSSRPGFSSLTPACIRFVVPGGPREDVTFTPTRVHRGRARGVPTVILTFTSVGHFNRVIEGSAQPIPVGSPQRIKFLTSVFAPLTTLLARYLQPSDIDLADPEFRETSTRLALHVAAAAIAQVANEDRSGRFSAHHVPDGDVALEVTGAVAYHLRFRDHRATFVPEAASSPRGVLTFSDLDVAGGILAGSISAIACISDGRLAMRGFISMVDNVNRILDRVGHYLTKTEVTP
jgi:hypothetical protein